MRDELGPKSSQLRLDDPAVLDPHPDEELLDRGEGLQLGIGKTVATSG